MITPWGDITRFYYTTLNNPNMNSTAIAAALGLALGVNPTRFFVMDISNLGNGNMRIDIVITDPYDNLPNGVTSETLLGNLTNTVSSNPSVMAAVGLPATGYILTESICTTGLPAFLPFAPVYITTESAGLFLVQWTFPNYASYCTALNMTFNSWRVEADQPTICRPSVDLQHFVECVALPGQYLNVSVALVCDPLESQAIYAEPYWVQVLRADAPKSVSAQTENGTAIVSWVPGTYTCEGAASTFSKWSINVTTNNETSYYEDHVYFPPTYVLPGGLTPNVQSIIAVSAICSVASRSSEAAYALFTPKPSNAVFPPQSAVATLHPSLAVGLVNIVVTTNALSSCDFANATFAGYSVVGRYVNGSGNSSWETVTCLSDASNHNFLTCTVKPGLTWIFGVSVLCSGYRNTQSAPITTNQVTPIDEDLPVAPLSAIAANPTILSTGNLHVIIMAGNAFNTTNILGLGLRFLHISDTPNNTVVDLDNTINLAFELIAVSTTGPAPSSQYASPVLLTFSYNDFNVTSDEASRMILFYYDTTSNNYTTASSSCPPSGRINIVDVDKQSWTTTTCHMTTFRALASPVSSSLVSTNRSLSGGAVAGIVIGVLIAIFLLILLLILLLLFCRRKQDLFEPNPKDGVFEPNSSVRSPGGLFEPNHAAGIANMPDTLRGAETRKPSDSPATRARNLFEPNYVAGIANAPATIRDEPDKDLLRSRSSRQADDDDESSMSESETEYSSTIRDQGGLLEKKDLPQTVRPNAKDNRGSDLIQFE